MEKLNDEIWVFLSHSHEDYEKVILVRDLLEKDSYRPIMFFLRCLENEEEVDNLIKREIDARKRFILCDSENARKSSWVQREVEYIKSKDRLYETINLDSSIEEIAEALRRFKRRSTVYIKRYSNTRFADSLYKTLKNEEFRIYNKREEEDAIREKYSQIMAEEGVDAYRYDSLSLFTRGLSSLKLYMEFMGKEIPEEEMMKWNEIQDKKYKELHNVDEYDKSCLQQSIEDGYVIHLVGKKEWHQKNWKHLEKLFREQKENVIIVKLFNEPENISKKLKELIAEKSLLDVIGLSEEDGINKILELIKTCDTELFG